MIKKNLKINKIVNPFPYVVIDNFFKKEFYIELEKNSNMFLAPPKRNMVAFNIGDINVPDDGVDCLNITGGKITLRLESMGDHVKVSGW